MTRYGEPPNIGRNRITPDMKEKFPERAVEDLKKAGKGMRPSGPGAGGAAGQAVKDAAGRAVLRTAGRTGLAGLALGGGYAAGRALDETTGVGRKLVDTLGGKSIDQMVSGGTGSRVKLTEDAKRRLAELDSGAETASAEAATPSATPRKPATAPRKAAPSPMSSVREGRNANIDDETRGRAMASMGDEETYAKGGKVRGDGIAQRGRTKGRII